jgi:hypothetical protein
LDKELAEYLSGARNCVSACVHISRQNLGNSEKIFIGVPDAKDNVYAFYNSKVKREKAEKTQTENGFNFESIPSAGTGGKEAYIMVVLSKFEKIPDLSRDAKAMIFDLFGCVEWNTCRLIRQRDKISLTKAAIAEITKMGLVKTKKTLSELIKNNVIRYDRKQKAYYLSRHFVKKGEERK